jgi:hypothetical protein
MGVLKKLKFWKRRDVGAAFQVHIDELQRKLEEGEATLRGRITELENALFERDIERDQLEQILEATHRERRFVEAFLLGRINSLDFYIGILEKKLEREKIFKNEAEAHPPEMEQMDAKILGQKRSLALEKILEEKDRQRAEMETTLHGQIEEMERRMEERQRHCHEVEIILRGQKEELERQLREQKSIHQEEKRDWEKVEEDLWNQIKQLKRTTSDMESDRQKLEYTVPCHIKEQEDTVRQTDKDELVEETLHGQVEELQEEDCGLEAVTEPRGFIRHHFLRVVIFFFLIFTLPVVLAYICELMSVLFDSN